MPSMAQRAAPSMPARKQLEARAAGSPRRSRTAAGSRAWRSSRARGSRCCRPGAPASSVVEARARAPTAAGSRPSRERLAQQLLEVHAPGACSPACSGWRCCSPSTLARTLDARRAAASGASGSDRIRRPSLGDQPELAPELHLVGERARRDAQAPGGLGLVAAACDSSVARIASRSMSSSGRLASGCAELRARLGAVRRARARARPSPGAAGPKDEVGDVDRVAAQQHDGALDRRSRARARCPASSTRCRRCCAPSA